MNSHLAPSGTDGPGTLCMLFFSFHTSFLFNRNASSSHSPKRLKKSAEGDYSTYSADGDPDENVPNTDVITDANTDADANANANASPNTDADTNANAETSNIVDEAADDNIDRDATECVSVSAAPSKSSSGPENGRAEDNTKREAHRSESAGSRHRTMSSSSAASVNNNTVTTNISSSSKRKKGRSRDSFSSRSRSRSRSRSHSRSRPRSRSRSRSNTRSERAPPPPTLFERLKATWGTESWQDFELLESNTPGPGSKGYGGGSGASQGAAAGKSES